MVSRNPGLTFQTSGCVPLGHLGPSAPSCLPELGACDFAHLHPSRTPEDGNLPLPPLAASKACVEPPPPPGVAHPFPAGTHQPRGRSP